MVGEQERYMSRSYPIWNRVETDIYKSSKDWGVRDSCEVEVKVGTGAKNSYDFVTHRTTHRELEDGRREFSFYVDGDLVKRAHVHKGGAFFKICCVKPGDVITPVVFGGFNDEGGD
jgi:hypothetical protein